MFIQERIKCFSSCNANCTRLDQSIKAANLPLVLAICGLVTHHGEIVITGKNPQKNSQTVLLECETWMLNKGGKQQSEAGQISISKTITRIYKIRPSKKYGYKEKVGSAKHYRRNSYLPEELERACQKD
jgi:hypothetical protein